jgi:hypothetical protein
LLSEELGVTKVPRNQHSYLVDNLLESTSAALTQVPRGVPEATVVVVGLGMFEGDVFVGKGHDLRTLVTMSVLAPVEVYAKQPLHILVRQLLRSEEDT